MNSLLNKYKKMPLAAKAALWFVICSVLQKCISFITVPIFTRIMPTFEYGIYSTYLSWYSVLTVFCTLNMHNCIYMNEISKAKNENKKNEIVIPMLTLGQIITFLIFILYLIFHKFLNSIIGLPTIMVSLLFLQIFFEPPVNFWLVKQRFDFKYVKLVILTISKIILDSILGIVFVLVFKNNQSLARVISIVLIQVIIGGYIYIYFYKKAKKIFSLNDWKHILKVQLPLLPHGLSLTILSSSDRIMINKLVGAVQAGIYSVAYSAGYIVNVLKNSMMDALRPWIYSKIRNKKFEDIKKISKTILILILIITFCFVAFAPELIMIMAPKSYYEAIYVIPPVAASSFFTFLYNLFSSVGFYYEKTNKIMIASVSGAIMNIILNFIFIPLFGYIVAAYTTLFCYIFFASAHYLIMKNICKKELENVKIFDTKFILILSLLVIIITILFEFIYSNILIRYSIILILILIFMINKKKFLNLIKLIRKEGKKE